VDIAMLVLRVVIGLYLSGHGAQKLFGWFGGPGLAGTTGSMRALGFRPAEAWALTAVATETVGGLLLLLGFLNPLGSLAIISAMLVATVAVHWGKGPFAMTGGPELAVTNMAVAVAVALAGPGRYALDSWLDVSLPEPIVGGVAAALMLIGVAVALGSRRPQERRTETPSPQA
jgi:putative oxidoreductase